jgi:hypothetical protein
MSVGLPALAASGSVPFLATLGASVGTAGLAGIGAGLGSFLQTGDLGDGIKTGLTSFLGGKILGGLTGSASAKAIEAGQGINTGIGELAKPKFLEAFPSLTEQGGLLASQGMQQAAAGALAPGVLPAAFLGQTMTDAQMMQEEYKNRAAEDEDTRPPMPRPMQVTQSADPFASGGGEGLYFQYTRPPAPPGYTPQYPYYYADGGMLDFGIPRQGRSQDFSAPAIDTSSQGRGITSLYRPDTGVFGGFRNSLRDAVESSYEEKIEPFVDRVERDAVETFGDVFDSNRYPSQPRNIFQSPEFKPIQAIPYVSRGNSGKGANDIPRNALYSFGSPAAMLMAEGGEVEVDMMMEENGMNEKDVIVEAIKAVKGMSEQPEIVLAMFVQKYGEDALRDLVGRVQSGEFDETVERFASGEKGMVNGPGDGSGVDDMVPATLEGKQDVLLADGEYVLRKKSTDALEKAYGGGFLDVINRAEEDAPKELERMVG